MTHPDPDAPATEPADAATPPNPQNPADARVSDEVADGAPPPDREFPADAQVSDEVAARDEVDERDEAEEAAEEDPLTAALRERDEYLDALRRKQADFENFRKRMMREGASQRITGHAEVAERMLDVLDDFDRTLAAAGDVDPGFLKGVQLVHDKLAGVLADFGLTRIDDTGEVFDPNRHEAVQQQSAEQEREDPVVAQVLRPGYELGGRVLRPAMVVVEQ